MKLIRISQNENEDLFNEELDKISKYYELIDKRTIGPYNLFLVKGIDEDGSGDYEVGINYQSLPFVSLEDQKKKKENPTGRTALLKSTQLIVKTLKEWVSMYQEIYIGSTNKGKTNSYYRLLSPYFQTSPIEVEPEGHGFPETYNFKIH